MFIPHTDKERDEMLKAIGKERIEDLFDSIPEKFRFPDLNLGEPMTEMEVLQLLGEFADGNASVDQITSFVGGGAYNHYIPAAIEDLTSRGEFYTAYTPYQPEISQGTLQGIFEFQTLIARLTGMEAANASHYDGATACAEAGILAYHHFRGKRKQILVSPGVNPSYVKVLNTYLDGFEGVSIDIVPFENVVESTGSELIDQITDETALVIIQYPNFFGELADFSHLAQVCHEHGTLLCVVTNPIALALFKSPGELGADIVVGEGQPLGIPLSYGGPYLGFFATKKELIRKISGRIVGETVDNRGQRGYVLTLTAREQHIRRDKATSNICSNQGLNALTAAMYLSLMGKEGLKEVARTCYNKAHYAASKISKLSGFRILSDVFFHEFAVQCPFDVTVLYEALSLSGITMGTLVSDDYPELENVFIFTATEMNSKEEIDHFCQEICKIYKECGAV